MKYCFIYALLRPSDALYLPAFVQNAAFLMQNGQETELVLLAPSLPALPGDLRVTLCPTEPDAFYSPQTAAACLTKALSAPQEDTCYLFCGNHFGAALCSFWAANTGLDCMQQVQNIQFADNSLSFLHFSHAGKIELSFPVHTPACLSIVPESAAVPADWTTPAAVSTLPPCPARTDVISFTPNQDEASLSTADLVWVGGRGMQNIENFALLQQLAAHFDAKVACTRPAGMNGWLSLDLLVGISGANLSAECCLVIGASGSSAFLSGIRSCSTIIAVNSDPNAEIFRNSDYKLVCSSSDFLSALASHRP